MKTYDFDKHIDRSGSGSVKWDEMAEGVLPLWVADMDFEAATPIVEAMQKRLDHHVFGYSIVPDAYYDAVINWFSRRHGWDIRREWIQYTIGVVPAISCCLKALTLPGDKVLLTTPVYNCFFSCIRNSGCVAEESPLVIGDDGKYHIDWDDFERRCSDSKVVAFILCNPHNPGGRVWKKEELEQISDICLRNHVTVISDEIHNELVMPGQNYIPYATVSDVATSISCVSASKSFNIAGLQIANIICRDEGLRRRIDRAININEVCDVNPFGIVATIAAYNECEDWIEQLNRHIEKNYLILQRRVEEEGKGLIINMPLEGTYLGWLDCHALCKTLGISSDELHARLADEAKVFFSPGSIYGSAGECFLRVNMACPSSTLNEGLNRLFKWIESRDNNLFNKKLKWK